MSRKTHELPSELRRRAEARLEASGSRASASDIDFPRLVHELQVHQIELELQNEELRESRQEAEAAAERYTELFDFAPIGYLTLAPDETIREVNYAAARLLGHERSRVIGVHLRRFVAVADQDALSSLVSRASGSEKSEACELRLTRADRALLVVRVTAAPVARLGRTLLVAMEDITERKAKAESLARTEAALREEHRRKDEFLAMLSHELRNPLAPMRNSLYVMQQADPASDKARWAREVIERQVSHLARMVDDLLDMTRLERGKMQLRFEHLELGALVRGVVDDFRGSFEAAGISLQGETEPGEHWVEGDPSRLGQVLSNLLGNAMKFTPQGGTVSVTLGKSGRTASLRVRDTGVGITPEVMRKLFQPFSQAPQTSERSRGGLGLGLAVVKGLVERHSGTVEITSPGLGQGTEVTITLRLVEAAVRPVPAAARAPRTGRRVLVIEDNPDSALSLRYALELEGEEVRVAYDGPTGLALARAFLPEVVFCDIGLPGMDGYAVARALRADEALRDQYLVALSGYAQDEDRKRALEAGFNQHVAKPANLDALLRLLEEAPGADGQGNQPVA